MKNLPDLNRVLADTRIYFAGKKAQRQQGFSTIPDAENCIAEPRPEWDPYEVWRRNIQVNR